MLHTPEIQSLQRTQSRARSLAAKFASRARASAPSSSCEMLTQLPLSFPVPPPLLPKLLRAGVNGAIAERVSAAVAHSIQRLKGVFEIDYNRRLIAIRSDTALLRGQNTLSFIPATYTAVYRRAVSNWSSYVLNVLAPRVLRVQVASKQITAPVNAPRRKPFNQEAVPKLERFFEQNAFPSRLEKMELATESNMEYRQIHVWFQNRRSRFKKEGKVLPKSVQRGTLLEELENTVVECLLPACPEAVDDDDNDAPLVTSCEDVAYVSGPSNLGLPLEPPSHAFPAPYPPLCACDPFPVAPERRAFATPWIRVSSSSTKPDRPAPSMRELITQFAGLSLAGSSELDERTPAHASVRNYVGFTTPCSRAPHPALVARSRRPARNSSRTSCQASSTQPCARNLNEFGSAAQLSGPLPQRKKRTLPRRFPARPPSLAPSHPFALSQTSSFPTASSPSSRTSSRVSSGASSSSPSTGSSSDSESPITTPELAPIAIPLDAIPGWSPDDTGVLKKDITHILTPWDAFSSLDTLHWGSDLVKIAELAQETDESPIWISRR